MRDKSIPIRQIQNRVLIFDLAAMIGCLILIIVMLFSQPPFKPDYIANVITGFTTLSGIMTAFIGFGLLRSYSGHSPEMQKWIGKRTLCSMIVVFIGLFAVMVGLSSLAQGNIKGAYVSCIMGTWILLFLFLDVVWTIYHVQLG